VSTQLLVLIRLQARAFVQGVLDLVDAPDEVTCGGDRGRFVLHDPRDSGAVTAVHGAHRQLGHPLQGLLQRLLRKHKLAQSGQALGQVGSFSVALEGTVHVRCSVSTVVVRTRPAGAIILRPNPTIKHWHISKIDRPMLNSARLLLAAT
jgi:hypothetical protein